MGRIAEQIGPRPEMPQHVAAAMQLRSILSARLSGVAFSATTGVDRIVDTMVYYLREEQAILASVTGLQRALNALLGRQHPTRPLSVRDFRVAFVMHTPPISEFPYLFDMLEDELGFRVDCSADTIEVSDRRAIQVSSGPHTCYAGDSAGEQ